MLRVRDGEFSKRKWTVSGINVKPFPVDMVTKAVKVYYLNNVHDEPANW